MKMPFPRRLPESCQRQKTARCPAKRKTRGEPRCFNKRTGLNVLVVSGLVSNSVLGE